ncbi:Uncharacterised protein [Serratia proteamaculans]|uniref:hypothetical protein n=1 Tax=Serratia proteamaculans TaxID=28151 RepID=UPI00217BFC63|nr:hypothetical protein [Serratia proteamaculans]CAI0793792.1 Uncharacterised protein [Serratia proteamaculans]CAI1582051.1 Uncharacterised protein [Serratia proteamaculans]
MGKMTHRVMCASGKYGMKSSGKIPQIIALTAQSSEVLISGLPVSGSYPGCQHHGIVYASANTHHQQSDGTRSSPHNNSDRYHG